MAKSQPGGETNFERRLRIRALPKEDTSLNFKKYADEERLGFPKSRPDVVEPAPNPVTIAAAGVSNGVAKEVEQATQRTPESIAREALQDYKTIDPAELAGCLRDLRMALAQGFNPEKAKLLIDLVGVVAKKEAPGSDYGKILFSNNSAVLGSVIYAVTMLLSAESSSSIDVYSIETLNQLGAFLPDGQDELLGTFLTNLSDVARYIGNPIDKKKVEVVTYYLETMQKAVIKNGGVITGLDWKKCSMKPPREKMGSIS